MSCKIEYISTFLFDVQTVAFFLREYPRKAARIFAKVDKSISNLKEMPEMYPVYMDVPSFRFIAVEDYLVFYRFIKESGIVEIHRLLYGQMDIPEHNVPTGKGEATRRNRRCLGNKRNIGSTRVCAI